MKTSTQYFFIICLVIILGLLSRKLDFIPLFVGDILYAVMIYYIVRFLFINFSQIKVATIAILICYTIEILQLYQASWIIEIRKNTFGHLIFGQGFLWSDILAYTLGIGISYILEKFTS